MTLQEIIDKDIFSILGLENLDEEKKKELFEKASETIQNRILVRLADLLSEEDVKKVVEFAEQDNTDGFEQLVASNDIDLEQIAAEETLSYKTEMASITEALKSES